MKFLHALLGFLAGLFSPAAAFFVANAVAPQAPVPGVGLAAAIFGISFGTIFHMTRRRLFHGFVIGFIAGCAIVFMFMKMMAALDTGMLQWI